MTDELVYLFTSLSIPMSRAGRCKVDRILSPIPPVSGAARRDLLERETQAQWRVVIEVRSVSPALPSHFLRPGSTGSGPARHRTALKDSSQNFRRQSEDSEVHLRVWGVERTFTVGAPLLTLSAFPAVHSFRDKHLSAYS